MKETQMSLYLFICLFITSGKGAHFEPNRDLCLLFLAYYAC